MSSNIRRGDNLNRFRTIRRDFSDYSEHQHANDETQTKMIECDDWNLTGFSLCGALTKTSLGEPSHGNLALSGGCRNGSFSALYRI